MNHISEILPGVLADLGLERIARRLHLQVIPGGKRDDERCTCSSDGIVSADCPIHHERGAA